MAKAFVRVLCVQAAVAFLGGLPAWGATIDPVWTGAGGDNKWGNAANWNPQVVPDGADGNDYRVRIRKDCTIEIEKGKTYKTYWFSVESGASVTLIGEGTLNNANWTFLNAGTEMIVDGPTVTIVNTVNGGENTLEGEIRVRSGFLRNDKGSGFTLSGTARVTVEGGLFGSRTTGSRLTMTNSAEVVITGGEMTMGAVFLRGNDDGVSGGTIRLLGGTYSVNYDYSYVNVIGAGATFDFKGGTIRWAPGTLQYTGMNFSGGKYALQSNQTCYLPPKDATLIIPSASVNAEGALRFGIERDYPVGGTIYVTNASDVATGNFILPSTVDVTGGGTIFANRLNLAPPANSKVVNLDLAALNLGAGGILSTTTKSQTVNFLDGIVFGSWADWSMDEPNGRKLVVKGPLAFDTTDALDPAQGPHAISATGFDVADVTELDVKGGGSVTLDSRNCPEQLRRIRVADGGTLALEGAFGFVKTMDFALGAGSTLRLDVSEGGCVDVAATATFGSGAKIVVTAIPAELTAKTQYPIFNLPPRKGDPAAYPTVELPEGVPDGWTVRWTANSCYLGDGIAKSGSTTGNNKYWTGAEDNISTNTNNWQNGSVLGSGNSGMFSGTQNTIIDNVSDPWKSRQFNFPESAGSACAYVFRGNTVGFSWPYNGSSSCSISLASDRPVVFESDITDGYQTVEKVRMYTDVFRFWSSAQGSVSLLGESQKTLPLDFAGDIRLGGTWTTTDLRKSVPDGADRRSRVTVLPSATLTVTEQESVQTKGQYYAVAAGGAMTVSGAKFAFADNDSTHFVDGALTVNCPFETSSLQTFRGSGTLALKGGVSAPDEVTTGGIRLEGENLTFVPGGTWSEAVPLTVRGSVTIAPEVSWTFAAPLNLDDHSTITVSGANVRLDAPLVSAGEVVVDGGRLVLGAAGTKLWKVSCVNDGCVEVADELLASGGFADVLSVRCDDSGLTFPDGLKIRKRYDLASDSYIYSAKVKKGMLLLLR